MLIRTSSHALLNGNESKVHSPGLGLKANPSLSFVTKISPAAAFAAGF